MRRDAFRIINRLHDLQERADKAPSYYASGCDADGEPTGIIENTGPHDAVYRTLQYAVSTNPFVKETLGAWGVKVSQRNPDYPPHLLNKWGRLRRQRIFRCLEARKNEGFKYYSEIYHKRTK